MKHQQLVLIEKRIYIVPHTIVAHSKQSMSANQVSRDKADGRDEGNSQS
jgi:hypothetical protein